MKKTFSNKLRFSIAGVFVCVVLLFSCKKEKTTTPPPVVIPPPVVAGPDSIPTDPTTEASIGFFMNNWVPKTFTVPSASTDKPALTATADAIVTINTGDVITKIAPTFFGNNTNTWIGQVGTDALFTSQLNTFAPRIIRAPGGSLSDVYFFNGPKDVPPADAPDTLLDGSGVKYKIFYWYGKNTESWTQSVDNYYTLLQTTNSKGLITVNYGYARYGRGLRPAEAAAHLAADWVRYDNGRTKYWEVGNESAGSWEAGYRIDVTKNKDGQPEFISGNLYGQHFKIFADSMRKAALEIGSTIYIGAQLIQTGSTSNTIDATWNSGYFAQAGNKADYYVIHDYFTPYNQNTNAANILSTAFTTTQTDMNWMKTTTTAAGVAMKPIAMTEWNLFANGSKQNVSHIAGVHAVLTLGEFIKNKYGAALRWDLANGWDNGNDHGLFSNGDEPSVAKWNPRPAFYHMYYFQQNTGDRLLSSSVAGVSEITAIATSFSSGQKGVVLVNTGTTARVVELSFKYFTPGSKFYYYVLSGAGDNGEFSRQVVINGKGASNGIAGGPSDYASINMYSTATTGGIKISVPERSVVFAIIDKR
jgi:hypothetical protein